MRLQKGLLITCASLLLVLFQVRCSSNNNNSTATPTPTPTPSNPNPTHFVKRVLVSTTSPTNGDAVIIDGLHDQAAAQVIATANPGKMVTANGQTVFLNTTQATITIFKNAQEAVFFTPPLQAQPVDIAITSDGKTAFAAIENKDVVEAVDTTSGNLVATVSVPSPARLVMSPNGTKLLVFSDDPQTIPPPNANSFAVIDVGTVVSNPVATAIPQATAVEPYSAVFNGSETKIFVLNCGAECGGTSASVVPVDFTSISSPVLGTPIPVAGATIGLLSGSNLFVAGTAPPPPGPRTPCNFTAGTGTCGTLSVINTGSGTVSGTFSISDGQHQVMAMSSVNHLYIGARECTVGTPSPQNTVQSCLSIFNAASNTMVPPTQVTSLRPSFNVTGLQQISTRTVLYVVQGGALDIFDNNTDNVSTSIEAINIPGVAQDVLQIDP